MNTTTTIASTTSTSEFETYKQNRINELKATYSANVTRLYSALVANLRSTQNMMVPTARKQALILSLVSKYNNEVQILLSAVNKAIATTNALVLPATLSASSTGTKRALLVGINYKGTDSELYGCINDALNIQQRLVQKGGFLERNIVLLTDDTTKKPTKNNILKAFADMLTAAQPGDLLFFLYSGHGYRTRDTNGDEADGMDEMIVTLDLQGILDDELKQMLQLRLKQGVTLVALFDSCFSGSVLDLRYQYLDSLNYDKYTEYPQEAETKGAVLMISGCTDQQTSADAVINQRAGGAMTCSLLASLEQKDKCTWRQLVQSMRDYLRSNGFDQIPQLSTGSFANIDSIAFL